MIVNFNTVATAAIVKANFTINGSLLISKGTWQIDDNTTGANLSINVSGNFNVEPTGRVTTGTIRAVTNSTSMATLSITAGT